MIVTYNDHWNPRKGTPDFKWQEWLNGNKNQNPKKSPDQSFTPQKSNAEFLSHKNFQKALNDITQRISRNISFD